MGDEGFVPFTVNHKVQIKNYGTGCCTNCIKGMWSSVKVYVGRGKRVGSTLQSYMCSERMCVRMSLL